MVVPVCASNARLSHGIDAIYVFGIAPTGLAELAINYTGNSSSFTDITVESYIQKRSLGFIWTKVDINEENNTWIDTSTDTSGIFRHQLQLNSTGTYRAVFKITFAGNGGADDVIEDKIEAVYE